MRQTLRIAIVGAGFSGMLTAVHLLRQSKPLDIDLIDLRLPGRGLAYSTGCDEHLLNVPASRMSALEGEPLHFVTWLQNHGMPGAGPDMFVSRKVYGTYIQDLFETAIRSANPLTMLRQHFTEAVSIGFDGCSASVFLRNRQRLEAEKVVLAIGLPEPRKVLNDLAGCSAVGWRPNALSTLDAKQDVLLLGSGMTAIDAFLTLVSQGHCGTIHMLSRHGKLPLPHEPYRPMKSPLCPEQAGARALLRHIRAEINHAEAAGVNWRAIIDALRPVTNVMWQHLGQKEQSRFFRHVKTWWDIHRSRLAPEVAVKVQDAIARRQLFVHAGRLQQLREDTAGFRADIRLRTGSQIELCVSGVINCTGPDHDYTQNQSPLIQSLLDSGYATPGSAGKGLQTTPEGDLVGRSGEPLSWLSTLGPTRIGDLLETIAVPEIRGQAEALAHRLLSVERAHSFRYHRPESRQSPLESDRARN